jgi:hypothetical protein
VDWNQYFAYDQETGRLTWKVKRPGPKTAVGKEAGSVKHDGRYRSVVLSHKRYYTHRIIWELMAGPIPAGMCIDHIDGDGLNNRWANLRLTTLSGNQRNRRVGKNNRTGTPGVNHHKNGFAVTCGGKYIGHFPDLATAVAARKAAEPDHDYHPNHGRNPNASNP